MELPDPALRLNALLETTRIAHEAIFDLHRELASVGRATAESRSLLEESVDATLRRVPALTSRARRLASRWREASVLRPDSADEARSELAAEVERIEGDLRSLIERQPEVAARLRSILER